MWVDSSDKNSSFAYIRLDPHQARKARSLSSKGVHFVTDNLQSWMDGGDLLHAPSQVQEAGCLQSVLVPSFRLDRYHPLGEVYRYLAEISKHDRVKVFDIGISHEGRPIKAVEIQNNPLQTNVVWIDGCTHAREWITVATAIFIIEQAIVTGIKQNFVIVPVINVDGYEYTWNTDRLWRKNRRPYQSSAFLHHEIPDRCNGVDLNRNFDINFGGEGSSPNQCSFLYGGPGPFSEPEVRAVGELLSKLRNRIKLFVSLHSFNQLWACPYAYTTSPTVHYNHHMSVLRDIQNAVFGAQGVKYQIGPLSTSLYVGSGFAMDWVYEKLGIVNSYLAELRDRGTYGFLLPVDQILPTASETWQGIMVAIMKVFL